jgi:hypothetical protein
MQNPTDQDEASIPMVTVREGPRLNPMGIFTVRRKAAKRSERWRQNDTAVLSTPARKKSRHGEHVATAIDNTTREAASLESSVGFLLPTTTTNDVHAFAGSVTGTQPIARAAKATGRWTPEVTGRWRPEEDAQLTRAVANTDKKRQGKEYKIDWVAAAAFVPGRTNGQCQQRWKFTLDPNIDRSAPGRTGKWTEDEDVKLQYSVQMHGGKDWVAIAKLVPGRTENQCYNRWKVVLDPSIDRANGRTGSWTEEEDFKLKYSVQMHSGKNWSAISALVQGRTENQCCKRWFRVLDPSINRTNGRTCLWTTDEDLKLKTSVEMHGGKDWARIAALIPDRTKKQCRQRWHDKLNPSIDWTNGRTAGKWTEDEDLKLKNSVETHGGKNWGKIAALVPGRTENQCNQRWRTALDPSIALTAGRTCKWTEDEDLILKNAVQTHGGKNWALISALVPGRTKVQCSCRWYHYQK